MVAKRHFGCDEGFKVVVVIVGGAAAPFGVGGRCSVLRIAGGRFRRLFGKDIVETGIQRLLDLGAAAEVAVHPFFLGRLEAVCRAIHHLGKIGSGILAIDADRSIGIGEFGPFRRQLPGDRRFDALAGPLQQRIALQFFLDKGRKVEIGQLQQLDGLHQLRRHYQRLGLAEL